MRGRTLGGLRGRSRSLGATSSSPAWTPSSLGVALITALDIPGARTSGLLWQDAGATTPAVADEDPIALCENAYGGADWTNYAGSFFPKLDDLGGGVWAARTASGLGALKTSPGSTSTPITVVMRYKANAQGGYNVAFSGGANALAVGYDPSDRLYSYTSTGYEVTGDRNDLGWHTIAAVIGGGTARLRYDGAQIGTGSNNSATISAFGLGTSGTADYSGHVTRCVLAQGDIGDTEIANAETWVASLT